MPYQSFLNTTDGSTKYCRLFNDSGLVWNATSTAYEAFNAAHITNYTIPTIETVIDSGVEGVFAMAIPSTVPSGAVIIYWYTQASTLSSIADGPAKAQEFGYWNGTYLLNDQTLAVLSGATVNITGSIILPGQTLQINQGDDYAIADSRAFVFTINNYTGPSLAGATLVLALVPEASYQTGQTWYYGSSNSFSATQTTVGSVVTISVPMTNQQTSNLFASPPSSAENYYYGIVATLASGNIVTIMTGLAVVSARVVNNCQ